MNFVIIGKDAPGGAIKWRKVEIRSLSPEASGSRPGY